MKKFLLILILFALAGAGFAQNNGKLPAINTSSSKTASKSKMPTISGVSGDKSTQKTAKPVQKPVEKAVPASNPTETSAVQTEAPVESETTEEPSLLKAAEVHKENSDSGLKTPDEGETVQPQASETVSPSETDDTTPVKPTETDGDDVRPVATPDDSTVAPVKSTNEPEQE